MKKNTFVLYALDMFGFPSLAESLPNSNKTDALQRIERERSSTTNEEFSHQIYCEVLALVETYYNDSASDLSIYNLCVFARMHRDKNILWWLYNTVSHSAEAVTLLNDELISNDKGQYKLTGLPWRDSIHEIICDYVREYLNGETVQEFLQYEFRDYPEILFILSMDCDCLLNWKQILYWIEYRGGIYGHLWQIANAQVEVHYV